MSAIERRSPEAAPAAGRSDAFEQLVGNYARLLRFVRTRHGGDDDAVVEIVQATFCRALASRATFRGESTLFTWLCTLCRREMSDRWRRLGRAPALVRLDAIADLPENGPVRKWDATRGIAELAGSELSREVRAALRQLPERYRAALVWKYLHGASVAEVGRRLGLSPKAAESLLGRARTAFRARFGSGRGRRR